MVEGSHVRFGSNGFYIDAELLYGVPDGASRLRRAGLSYQILREVELAELNLLVRQYAAGYGFRPSYAFSRRDRRGGLDSQFREKDALEQRSGEELADLDLYYIFQAPRFQSPGLQEHFMNQLSRLRVVEQVYPLVVAGPASMDVTWRQTHLDQAPVGVDAGFAWGQPGGRGDGVRVADVEYDWVTDHEDFPPAATLHRGGRPVCPYVAEHSEHGTAAVGIIAAPHNGLGVSGIAPNAEIVLSSICRPLDYFWGGVVTIFSGESFSGRAHNVGVAAAIQAAAGHLRPGDVLLIEQQASGPDTGATCSLPDCSQFEYVPVEFYPESFDIIRRVTAGGIIVVEAAGNGGVNLDGPAHFRWSGRPEGSSGAILVAASMLGPSGVVPMNFSNTSNRIDLNAAGGGVVTTGLGNTPGEGDPFSNPEIPRFYTASWGGTSSASAIVAGAVASVQGARLHSGQPALMPEHMRRILYQTGTPQSPASASMGLIGRQPNLALAVPVAIAPSGGFAGPGVYVIRPRHSTRALDLDISWLRGQYDGQPLIQWDFHGGDNQRFEIAATAFAGEYSISPVHSAKCLEVRGASTDSGAFVVQSGCDVTARPSQRFRIVQAGSSYVITAVHSGMILDVFDGGLDNGARLIQRPAGVSAQPHQLFDLARQ